MNAHSEYRTPLGMKERGIVHFFFFLLVEVQMDPIFFWPFSSLQNRPWNVTW